MKVKDVMTPDVVTVRKDALLKDAAKLMAEKRISGLIVVDSEGTLAGVLSEGDILFKERGAVRKDSVAEVLERWLIPPYQQLRAKLAARTAGEAMSAPAITIGPDRPVSEAANTMIDRRVNRLPVLDDAGNLVGIVTRADLLGAFIRSDDEIAREIREDVLKRALWIAPTTIRVIVESGEVELAGQVDSRMDAERIPEYVQGVPGVVSVRSKLRWQDE